MTNCLPDERVLAMYEAWARRHEHMLALLDAAERSTSTRPCADRPNMAAAERAKAQVGSRVVKALIVAWRRDDDERRQQRQRWVHEITERFAHLRRSHHD